MSKTERVKRRLLHVVASVYNVHDHISEWDKFFTRGGGSSLFFATISKNFKSKVGFKHFMGAVFSFASG